MPQKNGFDFSKGGKTKQEFKDDVDINRIIARYRKTGQVTGQFRSPGSGANLDLSTSIDFKQAQNVLIRARNQFAGLSAEVRKRFDNDPANFLAFMEDPKNVEEAVKLKLVDPPKPSAGPLKVEVVNPPAPVDDKK